ncbi:MAG: formylglycine-generating enzyme family protein [Pleurocapsa minor GSE-CHR-MK-17-07R]|nr:formylglycine-generating enzyme family protein [Pleurocapsa minor GSE-CHR-MK 17-07R]
MSFFSRLFAPGKPPPPSRPPKTILHPDYWCEIPAGEVQLGLTLEQKKILWGYARDADGYAVRPQSERAMMDAVIAKLERGEELSAADRELMLLSDYSYVPERIVFVPRFYIARFPITWTQMIDYGDHHKAVEEIPGTLETPRYRERLFRRPQIINRRVYAFQYAEAWNFCRSFDARFPSADEWEKAARGTDGRLYPWGNEWDETRGFFYSDQPLPSNIIESEITAIDAFPGGASPYGVMAMAGGLPEIVTVPPDTRNSTQFEPGNGETLWLKQKGCHARESSYEYACLDHVVALPGRGDWVSLRPVLDTWPRQQWRGVEVTP